MRLPGVRAAILAASLAASAAAQEVRAPDAERLRDLNAAFGLAIREALAGGARDDVLLLAEVLRGAPGAALVAGEWDCRTLKLGGLTALTVYPAFRCRIEGDGAGRWRFEKLTGSQRARGTLTVGDGMASPIYLGVGFAGAAPATGYAGLPPEDQSPVAPNQTHAQVGVLEATAPDRARLLLPSPILESRFDIIALSR